MREILDGHGTCHRYARRRLRCGHRRGRARRSIHARRGGATAIHEYPPPRARPVGGRNLGKSPLVADHSESPTRLLPSGLHDPQEHLVRKRRPALPRRVCTGAEPRAFHSLLPGRQGMLMVGRRPMLDSSGRFRPRSAGGDPLPEAGALHRAARDPGRAQDRNRRQRIDRAFERVSPTGGYARQTGGRGRRRRLGVGSVRQSARGTARRTGPAPLGAPITEILLGIGVFPAVAAHDPPGAARDDGEPVHPQRRHRCPCQVHVLVPRRPLLAAGGSIRSSRHAIRSRPHGPPREC